MSAVAEREAEQLGFDLPSAAFALAVIYVEHERVHPDPEQPRVEADTELRDSIARTGILQPITVRSHPSIDGAYMIVDGERRWRGAAGVQAEIPVLVREEQLDEAERLRTQLVANTGKPLAPLEEARAFAKLLQLTRRTQTELAEDLGRAKSTVADRLGLLELGAWVEKLERGELPLSHAVRVLLPLRTVPDDVHAKAIAMAEKDWRWQNKGGGAGISLGDFERLIEQIYRPFCYPLGKSKTTYEKQPEFNTKDHATECECGGIKLENRLWCGNPAWWGPRHRKAIALKPKEKAKGTTARRPDFHMPEGTPVVKTGYDGEPNGIVPITDGQKRWDVHSYRHEAYDPKDLEIDESKLVLLRTSYGTDRVGTKDVAAVKAARKKWADRWTIRRAEVSDALRSSLEKHARMFPVRGEGARQVLQVIAAQHAQDVLDCAEALRIAIPDALAKGPRHEIGGKVRPWIAKLADADVLKLATAIATLVGRNLTATSEQLEQETRKAIENIQKREVPWLKKPKGAKAKKGTKASAEAEDDDDGLEEDGEDLSEEEE